MVLAVEPTEGDAAARIPGLSSARALGGAQGPQRRGDLVLGARIVRYGRVLHGALGFQFGVYPDGSRGYVSIGPLTALDPDSESALEVLNQAAGPLPLSLEAFWREVGSVDFVGRMAGWPLGLDPLVVNPPEGALFDVEDGYPVDEAGRFDAGLAPDDLHKDNISGGGPYSVRLPEESADFPLLYERHELHFVPYLRMAILLWGGFPGLEEQDQPFVPLADLIGDLEAF